MPADRGGVLACRDLDSEAGAGALVRIIIVKFLSQPSRLDPDGGVDTRVVTGRAAVDFVADDRFLQGIASARQRLLDDEGEQGVKTIRTGKGAAGLQPFELGPNLAGGGVLRCCQIIRHRHTPNTLKSPYED